MSTSATTRPRVPWTFVILLAVVMACADGFFLTSLQEAVGAIERAQHPFFSWVVETTVAVPIFILAVLGAIAVTRVWLGPDLRAPSRVLAAAALIVVAGTGVGIAEVAASAAYDYHLQSGQVMTAAAMHTEPAGVTPALQDIPKVQGMPGMGAELDRSAACIGRCEAMRMTLAVHVRAVGYAAGVILLTNLILVSWVVAMRGGRVEVAPRTGRVIRPRAPASASLTR